MEPENDCTHLLKIRMNRNILFFINLDLDLDVLIFSYQGLQLRFSQCDFVESERSFRLHQNQRCSACNWRSGVEILCHHKELELYILEIKVG